MPSPRLLWSLIGALVVASLTFVVLYQIAGTSRPLNEHELPVPQSLELNDHFYRNTAIGFEVALPDRNWTLPSSEETDPHLYGSKDCALAAATAGRIDTSCAALEFYGYAFGSDPETLLATLNRDYDFPEGRAVRMDSLVPGAVVVRSGTTNDLTDSDYQYSVFFTGTQNSLGIVTWNVPNFETEILPTLKLLP